MKEREERLLVFVRAGENSPAAYFGGEKLHTDDLVMTSVIKKIPVVKHFTAVTVLPLK